MMRNDLATLGLWCMAMSRCRQVGKLKGCCGMAQTTDRGVAGSLERARKWLGMCQAVCSHSVEVIGTTWYEELTVGALHNQLPVLGGGNLYRTTDDATANCQRPLHTSQK